MRKEKIIYESYSITVYEKDLDPSKTRFAKEIIYNFNLPNNASYSINYNKSMVNVLPERK